MLPYFHFFFHSSWLLWSDLDRMAPPARVVEGLRTALTPMVGQGHPFLADDSLTATIDSVRRALGVARKANGDAPLGPELIEGELAVGYLPVIEAVQELASMDYQQLSLEERAGMWVVASGWLLYGTSMRARFHPIAETVEGLATVLGMAKAMVGQAPLNTPRGAAVSGEADDDDDDDSSLDADGIAAAPWTPGARMAPAALEDPYLLTSPPWGRRPSYAAGCWQLRAGRRGLGYGHFPHTCRWNWLGHAYVLRWPAYPSLSRGLCAPESHVLALGSRAGRLGAWSRGGRKHRDFWLGRGDQLPARHRPGYELHCVLCACLLETGDLGQFHPSAGPRLRVGRQGAPPDGRQAREQGTHLQAAAPLS